MAKVSESFLPSRPYVYALLDRGVPFYIGKGRGRRMYAHEQEAKRGKPGNKCERIRNILESGGYIEYQILGEYQTDIEAGQAEIEFIALHDGLTNILKGGQLGAIGDRREIVLKQYVRMRNRIMEYEDWIASLSDKKKEWLIRTGSGESLREQYDWHVGIIDREIADLTPSWVRTGMDGKIVAQGY